jgi:hypothetical protein
MTETTKNEKLLMVAELGSVDAIRQLPTDPAIITGHWPKYLPVEIRELWDSLDDESKLVAFICASNQHRYDPFR